jgi:hypothetical protein
MHTIGREGRSMTLLKTYPSPFSLSFSSSQPTLPDAHCLPSSLCTSDSNMFECLNCRMIMNYEMSSESFMSYEYVVMSCEKKRGILFAEILPPPLDVLL